METKPSFTSYKIIPELGLILSNFQGYMNLQTIIDQNKSFLGDPQYSNTYNVMLDFRKSLAIGFQIDVLDYISFFRSEVHLSDRVKVGFLYNSPNQEFLFKSYRGFGRLLKMEIELFREFDDCIQWFGYSIQEGAWIQKEISQIQSNNPELLY